MGKYFKFIKIEHTLFSLPIVFSGTFLAIQQSDTKKWLSFEQFFWILLAVLGARLAGFGMNRIIDKDFDALNPRTKEREIPSAKLSLNAAWISVFVASIFFIISAGMLSKLCLLLSPVPLALFLVYPFLKRFTLWSHLGLGVAWGMAPVGGWLAVSPSLHSLSTLLPISLLFLFCAFWVAGFDIIYALLDEDFDRENGLYSMPANLGKKNALRISEIFHAVAFLFLGALAHGNFNQPLSFLFLAIIGLLLIVSHWKVQFHPLTPPLIDFAFFKVNVALSFAILLLVLI